MCKFAQIYACHELFLKSRFFLSAKAISADVRLLQNLSTYVKTWIWWLSHVRRISQALVLITYLITTKERIVANFAGINFYAKYYTFELYYLKLRQIFSLNIC
jgi:hypothetical protein